MSEDARRLWDVLATRVRSAPPIPRVVDPTPQPLSSAQQRLLFQEQLASTSRGHIECNGYWLRGALDADRLRVAIGAVQARHDTLRTSIESNGDGESRQRVHAFAPLPFYMEDHSGLSVDERLARVRHARVREANTVFDLGQAPLWRVVLLRLRPRTHVALLTTHHIIWDQVSLGVFWRDVGIEYAEPGTLPPAAHQYVDFVALETERRPQALAQARAGAARLSGSSTQLALPTEQGYPAYADNAGGTCWLHLGKSVSDGVDALARTSGTTPFIVLATAFAVFLGRLSGQGDVLLGTPVSQRDQRGLQDIVGLLTNTLVLRADHGDDPSFLVAIERMAGEVALAMEQQDAPFDELVAAASPPRPRGRSPLVQGWMTLYPGEPAVPALGGVKARDLHFELGSARFDLELYLWRGRCGFDGKLVYRSDVISSAAARRWSETLTNLISSAVASPANPIGAIRLTTSSVDTATYGIVGQVGAPETTNLVTRFLTQVEEHPTAPAIDFGSGQIQYAELSERAAGVASALEVAGVTSGEIVGVVLERSPWFVIAILGVLARGAAYLPIDPRWPQSRVETLLEDAGAGAVVTLGAHASGLADVDAEIVRMEKTGAGGPLVAPRIDSGSAAYVTYTSGSTGGPKGVVVPHMGVMRLVVDADWIELAPGQRVGHGSATDWDVSTFEIWGALLNGGCVVGVPDGALHRPTHTGAILRDLRLDVLFVTTALFHAVAAHAPSAFASLRALLVGGDIISAQAVAEVVRAGPPGELINIYGPTENTGFSTSYRVDEIADGATTLPIGRPIKGTIARVVDRAGQSVPPGFVGELWLGGHGLALGYLGRPEQTDAVFVRDSQGERWYRSGDLARADDRGVLHFAGRSDAQLKVRGYRLEPEEVETTLRRHPHVVEAMVGAHDMDPERLIAFIVTAEGATLYPAELRAHLRSSLPEFMIPSSYVPIETLPKTPNGKLDRRLRGDGIRALVARRAVPEERLAPRSDTERRLADVWRRVLWLDTQPGVNDNFFDLGGHSLLAIQLVAEIESDFACELPLAALFQLDTISTLAAFLDAAPHTPLRTEPITDESAGRCVVVIDETLPYHDRDAGSRRLASLLTLMADLHDRVVFVPHNDTLVEPYASGLESQGIEIVATRYQGAPELDRTRQLDAALTLADLVWVCKPDLFERYAPLVRAAGDATLVYDTVDLHFVRLRGEQRFSRGDPTSWQAMKRRELEAARRADVTVAVTDEERAILERHDVGEVAVVPTVHVARETPTPSFGAREGLLFLGSYFHEPNVDAAVWLCEMVMPKVWRKLPDLGVTLLGSNPGAVVRGLANRRVTVPGHVDDLALWFDRHRLFVAPLQYGAGMKDKIGRALEFGLPVVTTSVGVEGFGLTHGVDVVIAEGVSDFARGIIGLYGDEDQWQRLSRAGRARLAPFGPDRARERLAGILMPRG